MDKIIFQYIKNACSELHYNISKDKYGLQYFNVNKHFISIETFDDIVMKFDGYTYSLYFKWSGYLCYEPHKEKIRDRNSFWSIDENTLILDFQNINGRTRTIFLTEEEKKELTKTIRETMRFEINE